jgi:malonyl CoA-acyl carrier protein transacylase
MPEVAKEINRFTTHASSLLEAVSKSVAENEKLNAHLRELADDQLTIKVRQEIQRLLNANMESSK